MNLELYGLLHLAEGEKNTVNLKSNTFQQTIEIFLKNAIGLSRSLADKGIPFILLTNNLDEINKIAKNSLRVGKLCIKEIKFTSTIPTGINFFSAHFKIDVFRYFAGMDSNKYIGLCDLDMIASGANPLCLKNIVTAGIPIVYDISDQVIPAHSPEILMRDMKKISPKVLEGRWYGGEFISGTSNFFAMLVNEIENVFPTYVTEVHNIFHQGDEMLTSVALDLMRQKNVIISDGGTIGIVGRYWNNITLHHQRSFKYFKNSFLLHLPADKDFLAKFAMNSNSSQFIKKYLSYKRNTNIKNIVKQLKASIIK